jgi:hypothetical protein
LLFQNLGLALSPCALGEAWGKRSFGPDLTVILCLDNLAVDAVMVAVVVTVAAAEEAAAVDAAAAGIALMIPAPAGRRSPARK